MNRFLRKLIGATSWPHGCRVCRRPWDLCDAHYTPLVQGHPEHGCFVLCEPCFNELNPVQRLPYYHELFAKWLSSSDSLAAFHFRGGDPNWEKYLGKKYTQQDWEALRDSVLAGL